MQSIKLFILNIISILFLNKPIFIPSYSIPIFYILDTEQS